MYVLKYVVKHILVLLFTVLYDTLLRFALFSSTFRHSITVEPHLIRTFYHIYLFHLLCFSTSFSQVAAIDLNEIIPEIEEVRSAKLYVDIFYRFVIGVTIRLAATNAIPELSLGSNVAQHLGVAPSGNVPVFPTQVKSLSPVPSSFNRGEGILGEGTNQQSIYQQQQQIIRQQQLQLQQQLQHQQLVKQRSQAHPSLSGQTDTQNQGSGSLVQFGWEHGSNNGSQGSRERDRDRD